MRLLAGIHTVWDWSCSDLLSNETCYPLWDCVCPNFLMTTGGVCPPGYYCPEGSHYPIACDGGKYCAGPGLALPTGKCVWLMRKVPEKNGEQVEGYCS